MKCLDLTTCDVVIPVIPRLSRTQGHNLHVRIGLIHAGQNPFGKPALSAQHVTYANQVAMLLVHFETRPKVVQVAFLAFEDAEEMLAGEYQPAADVIAIVVSPRRRDDFIEARRRKRRRWDAGPR